MSDKDLAPRCRNCGGALAWHPVGQTFIHSASGHCWCFDDRQGYDQPRAER